MEIDRRLVDEIVDRLTRVARPERIILFGSAATGRMTPDSDLDLLVVQQEVQDARAESRRLRQALVGLGFPVDVIVMRSDRFEETKGVIGGIAYPAAKYGKVIYLVGTRDPELAATLAGAADLAPYGVEYRYPGDYPAVSGAEAERSVDLAALVRREVLDRLPRDLLI